MKQKNSHILAAQGRKLFVGGANRTGRSFQGMAAAPLFFRFGKGASLYDQDDNAYTDYCLSWGSLVYGHAHRNVVLAAKKAAQRGLGFGFNTKSEIDLAKEIVRSFPSMERVCFFNSDKEALACAVEISRAFTKKTRVMTFSSVPSSETAFDEPASNARETGGVTDAQSTVSLPYNDTEQLGEAFSRYKDSLACVLLEPVMSEGGIVPGEKGFLQELRSLTRKHKIVLIFNEVTSGYRFHKGGAGALSGIFPDLICLGKIIGGGFPLGALGGRYHIMKESASPGGVLLREDLSANPVIMRAGLATLKLLNKDFYRAVNARAEFLADELNAFFREEQLSLTLSHHGTMLRLRWLAEQKERSGETRKDGEGSARDAYRNLCGYLLKNKVLWPTSCQEPFYISGMHRLKDCQCLLNLLKNFFKNGG